MTLKHYSPLINPTTGDYVLEKGDTVRDESLQFPAYARLKISRGKWLYAPDDTYGSMFDMVKKKNPQAHLLQSIAENALKPLLDDGRATEITVEKLPSNSRFDAQMQIEIIDKNTQPLVFPYTPID